MRTIKSRRDFERVFSRGRRVNDALLRVRVLDVGENGEGRVAFVAGKKLGGAVYRNPCKRVLREAARSLSLPAPGYDVILFATRATHDSTPAEVSASLARMLQRACPRWS